MNNHLEAAPTVILYWCPQCETMKDYPVKSHRKPRVQDGRKVMICDGKLVEVVYRAVEIRPCTVIDYMHG